ncbi:hypothetical protein BH18ACT12_BH18ACT12_02530 [soil metagenome]
MGLNPVPHALLPQPNRRVVLEPEGRWLHARLAEIVADQLDREQLESEKRRLEWSRIRAVLDENVIDVEFVVVHLRVLGDLSPRPSSPLLH